jgi:hypothetical protein
VHAVGLVILLNSQQMVGSVSSRKHCQVIELYAADDAGVSAPDASFVAR